MVQCHGHALHRIIATLCHGMSAARLFQLPRVATDCCDQRCDWSKTGPHDSTPGHRSFLNTLSFWGFAVQRLTRNKACKCQSLLRGSLQRFVYLHLALQPRKNIFMLGLTWHGRPMSNNSCKWSRCGSQQAPESPGWSHTPY